MDPTRSKPGMVWSLTAKGCRFHLLAAVTGGFHVLALSVGHGELQTAHGADKGRFHVDHIIAKQHVGETDDPARLALACNRCNAHKGPNLTGVDSETGDAHEILGWAMEPGDAIVFHALTLHGAPGNHTANRRRAYSTRWLGEDARYATRPGEISPLIEGHGLSPGDPMECESFPVVWRRDQDENPGMGIGE